MARSRKQASSPRTEDEASLTPRSRAPPPCAGAARYVTPLGGLGREQIADSVPGFVAAPRHRRRSRTEPSNFRIGAALLRSLDTGGEGGHAITPQLRQDRSPPKHGHQERLSGASGSMPAWLSRTGTTTIRHADLSRSIAHRPVTRSAEYGSVKGDGLAAPWPTQSVQLRITSGTLSRGRSRLPGQLRGAHDGEHAGELPRPRPPSGELPFEKRFPYSLSADENQHESRRVGRDMCVNVTCAPRVEGQ
jgi:hypothetical protein